MKEKQNLAAAAQDCMAYLPGMEVIESDILREVQHAADSVDFNAFTERDVKAALMRKHKTVQDFAALLSPAALPFLEEMAQQARQLTFKWFGAARSIFTPLYLANYCENYCVYCGFNCHNKINRLKLDEDGMEREMQAIAATGLREILLLTGESRSMSGVEYIASAVRLARKYFAVVGLEVYPLNSDEYAYLHECGADYVTVFQETYDVDAYAKLHLAGHKRVFPYRFYTQERALKGGMRGVAFAPLMGLSAFCRDIFACGLHAYLVQRKYPAAEISFSCPRLRPAEGNELPPEANGTDLRHLVQAVCAYRLFMPQAGITVSSREGAKVRDNLLQIAATKISAGVSTGIGTHSKQEREGDEQFEIDDNRSVDEVFNSIKKAGLQPVLTDGSYV